MIDRLSQNVISLYLIGLATLLTFVEVLPSFVVTLPNDME